tara:strand:- start:128 stop:541 length:414 start_codon:yes stop_codon:yes gene_type:complete
MVDLLKQIHLATSGTAIIVGGVARWLNGYKEKDLSRWIDISILSKYTNEISSLGRRGDIKGDTTWPYPVMEQFVVVTENKYILDVFVVDEPTEYTFISGSNVITPQSDLQWHTNMSGSIQSEYLHEKVNRLKDTYNL